MGTDLGGRVVFITGASAGIGEALAREAAQQGARVVLTARRLERVQAIAAQCNRDRECALGLACDVTRDGELEAAVAATIERFGQLDVLLANAGFGVEGDLLELTLADYRRQFETNVFGVLRSIYAAVPELKKTRGYIGVVGSANGYLNLPHWSAYCMSKHAVRSLCASLKHELRREGVSVTHLAPGFVASDFRRTDNDGRLNEATLDPVPSWLQMPANAAARSMLAAVLARQEESVITAHAKAVVGLERHVPWLVSKAVRASTRLVKSLGKSSAGG